MNWRGRALDAGVPAAWVASDEVYGANPALRAERQARSIGYVLAVACDHPVGCGGATRRADALLRAVPARARQQVSCGTGTKGHRYYDWAFIRLDHDSGPGPGGQRGQHWLLVRRNQRTGELAFYRCWMPHPVPLAVLGPGRRHQVDGARALPDRQGPVAWTSISSAAGTPGLVGSRWPCSPTPSWWWP